MIFALLLLSQVMAQVKIKQPPPSAVLIRHLELLERDLAELDLVLGDYPARKEDAPLTSLADAPAGSLIPPPLSALPKQAEQLVILQELRITLPQAPQGDSQGHRGAKPQTN